MSAYEIFTEKIDKSGIEKLRANECKCGGTLVMRTGKLKNDKMYWFACEGCGKFSQWSNMIQKAVSYWNEVADQ